MESKVIRHENGLAVSIPSNVALESALIEGAHVDVRHAAGRLIIELHRIDDTVDRFAETAVEEYSRDVYWGDPARREVVIE